MRSSRRHAVSKPDFEPTANGVPDSPGRRFVFLVISIVVNDVQIKTWEELSKDEFFEIAQLRCQVFFVEQRVDVQDFDDADRAATTIHYFLRDETGVYAYLRTLILDPSEFGAERAIGRMAVRQDHRGKGLATVLLKAALERWGSEPIILHAQEYVTALYAAVGFEIVGEPFDEAGIPHRSMLRVPPAWERDETSVN